jgi:sporulation protein YlmC with PRC-barrel domain
MILAARTSAADVSTMCEGSKVPAEGPATEDIMTHSRSRKLSLTFAFFVLCLAASPAVAQEIGLIAADTKEVAKGYRASALQLKNVVNDKGERIGRIDDFIFGPDEGVFAVLAVGEFVGANDHLVAVPFRSLKLDGRGGDIVLPGASRAALAKLPVFLYSR